MRLAQAMFCGLLFAPTLSAATVTDGTPAGTSRIESPSPVRSTPKGWITLGGGAGQSRFTQSLNAVGVIESEQAATDKHLEGGFVTRTGYGAIASYQEQSFRLTAANDAVTRRRVGAKWSELNAQGLWQSHGFEARLGFEQSRSPFIEFSGADFAVETLTTLNVAAGGSYTLPSGHWSHEFSLGYQHPVSAQKTSGGSIVVQPDFSFSSRLRSSYAFTPNWSLGLALAHRQQQQSYRRDFGDYSITGHQRLTATGFNLDLGYLF